MIKHVTKTELRHRELIEKLESIQKNTPNEEISTKITDLQINIKELITESNRSLGLAYVSVAFAFISIAISTSLYVIILPLIGYIIIFVTYLFAGVYVLYSIRGLLKKFKK